MGRWKPGDGSGGSNDVVRMGSRVSAGGVVLRSGNSDIARYSSCSVDFCWVSVVATAGSKLKGRLSSFGGGSGVTGEISASFFARTGFNVGEGVISGVMVCNSIVGIGGAGLIAYEISVNIQYSSFGTGSRYP